MRRIVHFTHLLVCACVTATLLGATGIQAHEETTIEANCLADPALALVVLGLSATEFPQNLAELHAAYEARADKDSTYSFEDVTACYKVLRRDFEGMQQRHGEAFFGVAPDAPSYLKAQNEMRHYEQKNLPIPEGFEPYMVAKFRSQANPWYAMHTLGLETFPQTTKQLREHHEELVEPLHSHFEANQGDEQIAEDLNRYQGCHDGLYHGFLRNAEAWNNGKEREARLYREWDERQRLAAARRAQGAAAESGFAGQEDVVHQVPGTVPAREDAAVPEPDPRSDDVQERHVPVPNAERQRHEDQRRQKIEKDLRDREKLYRDEWMDLDAKTRPKFNDWYKNAPRNGSAKREEYMLPRKHRTFAQKFMPRALYNRYQNWKMKRRAAKYDKLRKSGRSAPGMAPWDRRYASKAFRKHRGEGDRKNYKTVADRAAYDYHQLLHPYGL